MKQRPAIGDAERVNLIAQGSRDLLRAILRYAVRHNLDLGLDRETFAARCRDVGLVR